MTETRIFLPMDLSTLYSNVDIIPATLLLATFAPLGRMSTFGQLRTHRRNRRIILKVIYATVAALHFAKFDTQNRPPPQRSM